MTANFWCPSCGWPDHHILKCSHSLCVTLILMWTNSYDKFLAICNYHSRLITIHVYCILQSQTHNKVHISKELEESPDQTSRPALLVPDGPPLQPLQCPEISWSLSTGCAYHVKSFHLPTFPGLKITSLKSNLLVIKNSVKICRWHRILTCTLSNSTVNQKIVKASLCLPHKHTLPK